MDVQPSKIDVSDDVLEDLQRWTEMPRGGHFADLKEPQRLVKDIRAFFRPLRG